MHNLKGEKLDIIKNKKDFIGWLDSQLDVEIPQEIIAFNININESPFNIEIVGSNEFRPDDSDWACNEDWVPHKRNISVSDELFGVSWEQALENLTMMSKAYLSSNSTNTVKLKEAKAFAIGFVDGDLKLLKT